jgi:transcriptional regulator PpsR
LDIVAGMETQVARKAVDQFNAPKRTLGDLDAEAAAKVIAAAADVALVIDAKGIVKDVAFSGKDLTGHGFEKWLGLHWVDTVTIESRAKIEELLSEARDKKPVRARQVNHPSPTGTDVPIRYSAVQVAANGRVVVVGRDLRSMSALQQRLVDVQQSMEREYARLRHAETRYRLLFQIASEAVLIIDAGQEKIVDANPAATQLLTKAGKKLNGREFSEIFDTDGARAVQAHLAAVRSSGRAEPVMANLTGTKSPIEVSASLFRQETTAHFLVRLMPGAQGAGAMAPAKSNLFDVVEKLPDGFVVTDLELKVLTANTAFLELTQVATMEQVRGESLSRWLGRQGVDINVMMTNLREHGAVKNFASVMRGEFGTTEDVELSAVAVMNGEHPCIGFTIRNVGMRPESKLNGQRALPRSVEQLTGLVGRVSLKELVRESTDMIERLCIEAALELTGDNRASAAEILGLSRQGLYSKLRRYGLGDLEHDGEA